MSIPRVGGIHHVTAIAGDPQENVDFYAGTLGMRMVKRSVNQDDPSTYHLFYADAVGHPGSDLTFFPWPHMGQGSNGTGLTNEVVFAVAPESLAYWRDRLAQEGLGTSAESRFGEPTLVFQDHHGMHLAIAATRHASAREFTPWKRSVIPEAHQIRGIHAVRVVELNAEPTAAFAQHALGMTPVAGDDGWQRFAGSDPACGFLDITSKPSLPRGQWGVGKVHHVAWRTPTDASELELLAAVRRAGLHPTNVIDRFWFRSVYFREPGGVLFEIATDGPGFGVDEHVEKLGEKLVLPPWLETHRAAIEAGLPAIQVPGLTRAPSPARQPPA